MIKFFKTLSRFFGVDVFGMTYTLKDDEKELWTSIVRKAKEGYDEYIEKYPNWYDNICPAWVKDYTDEEYQLVHKIHEKFYPGWYSSLPISGAQIMFEMYWDIKDKVIY